MMNIIKQQIDIGLVCSSAERCGVFYRDFLGLKQGKSIPLGDGIVQDRFFIGRNVIKLNTVPNANERMSGGMENAIGIRLLALLFEDLHPILDNFKKAGIKHSDAIDYPGAKLVFVKDYDGNLLELVQVNGANQLDDRIQVGLCVNNINASQNFYGNILHFAEEKHIDMGDGSLRYGYRGNDTLVKFWQAEKDVPMFSGYHFSKVGLRYFTYTVSDLDETFAYLKSKGVSIMREPIDIDGVAKVLLIADPDNNCIEFVEYY